MSVLKSKRKESELDVYTQARRVASNILLLLCAGADGCVEEKSAFTGEKKEMYMDDIYAIHSSRIYLEECLGKIRTLAKIDGIELNERKTKIVPLERGFSFLKVRYRITESGHIIRIPDKSAFRREKRRIRKMRALVDEDVLTADELLNAYKSWRKPLEKLDCHRRLLECDEFFMQSPILS